MARSDKNMAVLQVNARGLRKMEKMVQTDQKYIREIVRDTVEEVGIVAMDILRDYAPERTGRLKEGIHITGQNRSAYKPNIRVGVDAVSDQGFDYLNVTRFGRRAVVASKSRPGSVGGAKPARTYEYGAASGKGRQLRPFRAHMLKFTPGPPGSGFIYRPRVRAYRPKRDWVRASQGDIKDMTNYAFVKVTKQVEMVLNAENSSKQRATSVYIKSRYGKFHT